MEINGMDRRMFLRFGVVLGGGVALMPLVRCSTGSDMPAADLSHLPWYQRPLRILQTVLREPDATNYNANAVVDYMEKAGCNTLVVNAGGIVDFFQNPLPLANVNSFMGDRDILRDITTACKAKGFRVIGRVDFRGVEEPLYKQFPDWFSVDAAGKPMQLNYTRPQLYSSCYTGYHRNEHAEEFIRHLLTNYNLDGIWHNSIGVVGICYCERCRESYKAASGGAIPELTAAPEELDRYMDWKSGVADQHMERMKKTVKSFGEDKVYTAEVFSMFETGGRINSGIDLYNARDHFDFLVSVAFLTENSEIIHYEDLSYAGTLIKFLKSMAPEKEAIILYGGNGTAHRYVMDPPVDLKVWLWEMLAVGGRFWNCSFTGSHPTATHDRRNAFNNVEAYSFVREHETLLAQHVPVASVGLYYSRPTRLYFRGRSRDGDRFDSSLKGMDAVLTENHIPYDFIADDQITRERLQKYALVILSNVKCLTEGEVELIREYVNNGGSILATYETSLFHADGSSRSDFALADMFGCHFTGEKVNTRKDCYQFIADPSHAVVRADSGDTELLINAGFTLLCKPESSANMICSYVPLVHNQPPEKAWTTEWAREFPTLLENRFGKGKVLYFSNQPDQISYENGHPDFRNLLSRSIRYLAGNTIPVETDAPASVHLGLTQSQLSEGEYILSLVNTTSGPVRPLRNILPVFNIHTTLKLNGKMKRYTILRSNGEVTVQAKNSEVKINLARLDDYFSVHIVMES